MLIGFVKETAIYDKKIDVLAILWYDKNVYERTFLRQKTTMIKNILKINSERKNAK